MISFNKPYLTGKETHYIEDAVKSGKISGNGKYTNMCQKYFEQKYGFKKCLLTTSCTDALEMAAILLNIKQGDEVIVPSYTFVSSALAFVREGAKIVFADSRPDHPGINEDTIEELITEKTIAIVVVHYAGVSCDMHKIMSISKKYNIFVVEDAAQAIDSFYTGNDGIRKALGSIGHLSAFSFHETKNIISGEGGMLCINDDRFINRSEIIWEKGTNRAEFFRGEVNKYGWVDTGSSFLPSEIIAAFLWAQLENLEKIQQKRKELWSFYFTALNSKENSLKIRLPSIPQYSDNNAHMFYILTESLADRTALIAKLKSKGIMAVFHYLSLHKSNYYQNKYNGPNLEFADFYSNCLLRLPLYYELGENEIERITNII